MDKTLLQTQWIQQLQKSKEHWWYFQMWGVEVLWGSAPQRFMPDNCNEKLLQDMRSISLGDFMASRWSAKDSHSVAIYKVGIMAREDVRINLVQWLKLKSKSLVWCPRRLCSISIESQLAAQFRPGRQSTREGWGYKDICIPAKCSNEAVKLKKSD